jgi:hypothetical protein
VIDKRDPDPLVWFGLNRVEAGLIWFGWFAKPVLFDAITVHENKFMHIIGYAAV